MQASQVLRPMSSGQGGTSPRVWLASWVIGIGLIMLRVPTLRQDLSEELARNPELSAGVTDSRLLVLSVNIGLVLGVAIAALIFLLYQSLGRVLEQKLYPDVVLQWRGARLGPFCLITVLATYPVHLFAIIMGSENHNKLLTAVFALAVGVSSALAYREHIGNHISGRLPLFLLLCLTFAVLSVIL